MWETRWSTSAGLAWASSRVTTGAVMNRSNQHVQSASYEQDKPPAAVQGTKKKHHGLQNGLTAGTPRFIQIWVRPQVGYVSKKVFWYTIDFWVP